MMLNVALKEWDLVIRELLAGRQAILLRKGGILESVNEFELEHPRFLFFPTYIHQDPRMVKPEKRGEIRMTGGVPGVTAEPAEVEIPGYGEAARIFEVPGREAMDALRDLHVWDEPLIDLRFSYRAEKPLYLVVVRAFAWGDNGATPPRIANTPAYAGCKSWVPLEQEIAIAGARPVLPDDRLRAIITRIARTFEQ